MVSEGGIFGELGFSHRNEALVFGTGIVNSVYGNPSGISERGNQNDSICRGGSRFFHFIHNGLRL